MPIMIVLNLSCANGHHFEGWFASAPEFERQSAAGDVVCPLCGDHGISRLPSSPHVMKGAAGAAQADGGAAPAEAARGPDLQRMLAMVHAAWSGSEDVGERFPEEARRIHYEEAPSRAIRGVATRAEAAELVDEGIQVLSIPLPPTDKMH